jgi:mannose-1-phosphate guanylyltransferase/mannose-6-phosphate isomerase
VDALFGVEDLVVVASQDAVLVTRRTDPDGMRRLVEKLREG